MIDQVAAETNLLSLNASIVAAQAGNARPGLHRGGGADLDARDRTAASSREITAAHPLRAELGTHAVQAAAEGSQSVSDGVKRTRGAAEALSHIITTAEESADTVGRIADASQHQAQALREVEDAFRGVRENLLQIGRAVSEQRIAAGRVHEAMERTSEVTEQVERAGAEQAAAVARISSAAHETDALTGQVSDSTQEQSHDSRQVIQALGLFRDIAGRTVENAEAVQRVVDLLGRRAETLGTRAARHAARGREGGSMISTALRAALCVARAIALALLAPGAAAAEDHVIVQRDKAFSQERITLRAGDRIVFKNEDTVSHNVFSRSPGSEFEVRAQLPGQQSPVVVQEARPGRGALRDPSRDAAPRHREAEGVGHEQPPSSCAPRARSR